MKSKGVACRGVASLYTLWVTKIDKYGGCQRVTKFSFLMVGVSGWPIFFRNDGCQWVTEICSCKGLNHIHVGLVVIAEQSAKTVLLTTRQTTLFISNNPVCCNDNNPAIIQLFEWTKELASCVTFAHKIIGDVCQIELIGSLQAHINKLMCGCRYVTIEKDSGWWVSMGDHLKFGGYLFRNFKFRRWPVTLDTHGGDAYDRMPPTEMFLYCYAIRRWIRVKCKMTLVIERRVIMADILLSRGRIIRNMK